MDNLSNLSRILEYELLQDNFNKLMTIPDVKSHLLINGEELDKYIIFINNNEMLNSDSLNYSTDQIKLLHSSNKRYQNDITFYMEDEREKDISDRMGTLIENINDYDSAIEYLVDCAILYQRMLAFINS